jgi:hypothetical protein
LNGSKHLQFLLDKKLIEPKSSSGVLLAYSKDKAAGQSTDEIQIPDMTLELTGTSEQVSKSETVVLDQSSIKHLAESLEVPELVPELERAVSQVETSLGKTVSSEEETSREQK